MLFSSRTFLRTAIGLVILFIVLLCYALVARHLGTAPHEFAFQPLIKLKQPQNLQLELQGCFLRSRDPSGFVLKALSLSPRVKITSEKPVNAQFVMRNIDHAQTDIHGATLVEVIPNEMAVRVSVSVKPSEPITVEFRPIFEKSEFEFYVIGDTHNRFDILKEALLASDKERPLFIFHVGDLVRPATEKTFSDHERFVLKAPVPYFTALGNHDLIEGDKPTHYLNIFGPTYYSFSYAASLFIVLDNTKGFISFKQLKWLKKQLADANMYRHIFVFAHQPPWDQRKGHHHSMKPIIGGIYFLTKMLTNAGVDLFISGHIHTYSHFQMNGLNVLVSGGGGPRVYDPFPFHHYVAIRVRDNSITQQLRLP